MEEEAMTTDAAPRRGRRRSATARRAVLDAAAALLAQGGIESLTIEGIAARAGVGKPTIYRWWADKEAVAVDAFLEHVGPLIAFPDTGSARDDLRKQLGRVVAMFRSPTGVALAELIGASQHNPALAAAIEARFIAARRAAARAVFERGRARGEVRADLNVEVAIDALYGALYYRLLVSHAPLDQEYVDALLAQFWPALAAPP